ncbi:uncharacterized protein [Diabrotica undecimpunctata]|uniref:uncharacterized protein n=1 Tax=Diabrotica undecimpunctata TaxID=50387 RepID=UPI003B63290E
MTFLDVPDIIEEEKRKARERYRARKEAGKVKRIDELSEREQRNIRKCWREKSKKSYYAKKERETLSAQLNEIIPSFTPVPEEFAEDITPQQNPQPESSRQSLKGKQIVRRNRKRMKKEIELLKAKLERTCKKVSKYKKRYERLKKKGPDTPTKNVREMLIGQKVTPEVKRKLVIGEVLQQQVKENYKEQRTFKDKQRFVVKQHCKAKKYRCENLVRSVSSRRILKNKNSGQVLKRRRLLFLGLKEVISSFSEKDEVSRLCPGKKDTVIRKLKSRNGT